MVISEVGASKVISFSSALSCLSCVPGRARWRSPVCGFSPCRPCHLYRFRRAPLIAVHLASHFLAGTPRVFSFPFLSHSSLLTKVPVKVIQQPLRPFPLPSASRTAMLTIVNTLVLVLLHVAPRQQSQFLRQLPVEMFLKNRARSSSRVSSLASNSKTSFGLGLLPTPLLD
jgi:hypothetical protein